MRLDLRLMLALLLAAASLGAAEPRPDISGHWEGAIELPGQALEVLIDFERGDAGWEGRIDIPAQGAMDLPLAEIRAEADSVAFLLAGVPGDPRFAGLCAGEEIAGTFTQNGFGFPFRLTRGEDAPKRRPQDPIPPWPYVSTDVSCGHDGIVLAGTLTRPEGPGPFPAVLLISGSGPQNRDEEIFDHRPFLVLADHLTRRGLAVLRLDDRGVGASTGDRSETTTEDYCDDALAGVRFLAAHPHVDPRRIGLVGHSEGGTIAPMAAVRCDSVAFLVLLAGPGVPGNDVIVRQVELVARGYGLSEAQAAAAGVEQRAVLDMVIGGADEGTLRARLRTISRSQMAPGTSESDLDAQVDATYAELTSPWYRYFLSLDPRPVLERVTVPVLALNGAKDRQVDPEQNLTAVAAALAAGGNPDVTTRELPDLNHLFQTAQTGSPAEYWSIEETFAPAAMTMVSDWILERFGD